MRDRPPARRTGGEAWLLGPRFYLGIKKLGGVGRRKPREEISSSTHSLGLRTMAEEEKEREKEKSQTSLVVQWLRIQLPMQRTWVQTLVQEDSTCCGVTKPICHSY